MVSFSTKIIIGYLFISSAWAGLPDLPRNSLEAKSYLQKILSKKYDSLSSDDEKKNWVEAKIALISLDRLQGDEESALAQFDGFDVAGKKWAKQSEIEELTAWGCQNKREAKFCLPK